MKNFLKNKITKYYLVLVGLFLSIPSFVKAADHWTPGDSIVPSCGCDDYGECSFTCGYSDLIQLIDNLLYVFIWLAAPIATVLFAWIGWDLIVNSSKASAKSKAKERLSSLLIGMFWVLGSWLVVKLIVSSLGGDTSFFN